LYNEDIVVLLFPGPIKIGHPNDSLQLREDLAFPVERFHFRIVFLLQFDGNLILGVFVDSKKHHPEGASRDLFLNKKASIKNLL
jgi:hypothetical protein